MIYLVDTHFFCVIGLVGGTCNNAMIFIFPPWCAMFHAGSAVGTVRGLYGYSIGTIRVLFGTLWVLYGYSVGTRLSLRRIHRAHGHSRGLHDGYCLGTSRVLFGYFMGTQRVLFGYFTGTVWVLHGYSTGTVWVHHGYSTGTIWVLYGYSIGTRVPLITAGFTCG